MFDGIYKAVFIVTLIALLLPAYVPAQVAAISDAEKIKAEVYTHASVPGRVIKVKMRDGRRLKGRIYKADADTFELIESQTRRLIVLSYKDVASVNRSGMSDGTKLGLLIGGAGAALTLAIIFRPKRRAGGIPCLLC